VKDKRKRLMKKSNTSSCNTLWQIISDFSINFDQVEVFHNAGSVASLHHSFETKEDDEPALKRKVIRGGSWKDIAYYMQCGTRTYEYQDTAKCYLGFRNVMTYLGRAKGDEI